MNQSLSVKLLTINWSSLYHLYCILLNLNNPVDIQIEITTSKTSHWLSHWGIAQPAQSEMKSHKNERPGFRLTFDVAAIILFACLYLPSCCPLSAVITYGPLLPSALPSLTAPFDLAGLNLVAFTRHTAKQSLKRLTQTGKRLTHISMSRRHRGDSDGKIQVYNDLSAALGPKGCDRAGQGV